jgi:hypothetical protein
MGARLFGCPKIQKQVDVGGSELLVHITSGE